MLYRSERIEHVCVRCRLRSHVAMLLCGGAVSARILLHVPHTLDACAAHQSALHVYAPFSPQQVLEDYCQKSNLGTPTYQLHSTMGRDGGGDVQLFLFKVIPQTMIQENNSSE